MHVTTKLKMDLSKPDFGLSMNAVQGDAYTRSVSIALYNGLQPWTIPDNVKVAIRYAKPDNTKGYYDTLPNDAIAWSCQENVLTVHLAPQMLTVAGDVNAQVELIQDTHILSTFCLTVRVEANPAAGVLKSEDYINWLKWIQEQSEEYTQQVQTSAQSAGLSSQIASQAAEKAVDAESEASISAQQATDAAESAASAYRKTESIAAEVSAIVAGNEAYTKLESNSRYSPALIQTKSGHPVVLSDSASTPLQPLKLYGKTTQNGTPTPESPVALESLGDSVKVTICGRNLVDVFNENMSVMRDGKTATSYPNIVNDDGSLTINVSGSASYGQGFQKSLCAGQTVTISFIVDGFGNGTGLRFRIFDTNDYSTSKVQKDISVSGKFSHTFTPTADGTYMFGWYVSGGSQMPCGARIHDLQLEFGSVAKEYEPYNDGGVLTISLPNGLPGIPVSSGGNYTDENGQQWICDEVNLGTGKYVQRIGIADKDSGWKYYDNGTNPFAYVTPTLLGFSFSSFTGTINRTERMHLKSNCLTASNSGASLAAGTFSVSDYMYIKVDGFTSVTEYTDWMAEKDFKLLYILETPVYQELSEEALAQYTALHTNYPNTTVFNDRGADMEVKYIADPKLYIDHKFNQLATELVNNL